MNMTSVLAGPPPDIFEKLDRKWQSTFYASSAFHRDNKDKGEFHVAFVPPLKGDNAENFSLPTGTAGAKSHPLPGTLIELVDSAPKNSWIRVSVYMFSNLAIKNALVKAIQRGVVVRVITTNIYGISDNSEESDSEDHGVEGVNGKIVRAEMEAAMVAAKNEDNYFLVCEKSRPGRADPGGCISNRLNHQKFMTLSRVCRFGLLENGGCQGLPQAVNVYHDVIVQGSFNYTHRPRHSHEAITVLFGHRGIYEAYVDYFNKQKTYSAQASAPAHFHFEKQIQFSDSSQLTMHGMPRERHGHSQGAYEASDVFLSSLKSVQCMNGNQPTILRIAVAHWSGVPGEKVVDYLSGMKKQGCDVRVLVKKDLVTDEHSKELYKQMKKAINVRVVVSSKNKKASLHAKYATVEEASSRRHILMFGTLSFNTNSQSGNDEMWQVWRNPSTTSFHFYTTIFDKIWLDAK